MNATGSRCPPPLIDFSFYHSDLNTAQQWCETFQDGHSSVQCCVPCPITDWVFRDGFEHKLGQGQLAAAGSYVLIAFLIMTYIFLPPKVTMRHHLTITPLVGFIFLSTAFVVGEGQKRNLCYNEITPHDHRTDSACFGSSLCLMVGIWLIVLGCFFRTLSLHLQVVWEISLGFKFFICSDAIVWAWTVLMVIIEYYFSGFSYQLGRMCQINYANGYATFWGELFAFGGLILFFQSWTICYTIRTAFRSTLPISWGHRKNTSQGSSSINTKLLRSSEVWRRIGKLLIMQWRFVLLVVAVFFHAIIISYALLGSERNFAHTPPGVREWMECVIAEGKEKCLPKAANLLPTENVVVASLAMLATCYLWAFLVVFRWQMITGWIDFYREWRTKANTDTQASFNKRGYEHGPENPVPLGSPKAFSISQVSCESSWSHQRSDIGENWPSSISQWELNPQMDRA